jgi:hypothetical protein
MKIFRQARSQSEGQSQACELFGGWRDDNGNLFLIGPIQLIFDLSNPISAPIHRITSTETSSPIGLIFGGGSAGQQFLDPFIRISGNPAFDTRFLFNLRTPTAIASVKLPVWVLITLSNNLLAFSNQLFRLPAIIIEGPGLVQFPQSPQTIDGFVIDINFQGLPGISINTIVGAPVVDAEGRLLGMLAANIDARRAVVAFFKG